jgi:hypothetical protein
MDGKQSFPYDQAQYVLMHVLILINISSSQLYIYTIKRRATNLFFTSHRLQSNLSQLIIRTIPIFYMRGEPELETQQMHC